MVTRLSGEGGGSEESISDRVRRMAEVASAQARVIARRAEQGRARRRWGVVLGCAAGVVGLVALVGAAFFGERANDLWWLLVPAWILGATPMLILAQRDGDALGVLGARAAGTAEVADGLRRTVEAEPSRFEPDAHGTEALGPLTSIVARDIEGARRSLQARAGSRRRSRRVVPRERKVIVTTHDGRRLRATIADVSTSGVAMTEALPRLEKGQTVVVGRTWARVARTWDNGVAFEFEAELDASSFDEGILL